MDDPFELYLDRLNVQDILYYAGYRQNRRDGLRYPSFVRLDNDGRRIHGDKFICMPGGKTCFKPPTVKSYNIISLITSFPEFFQESATNRGADLVHAVCRSILNMPKEERNTQVLQPLNPKPFNINDYKVHELHGCNPDELKYFMPYMRERGISLQTLKAFSKDVLVTQKNADGDKFFYRNFSFPFRIPGNIKDIVGLEERGRARLDGTSGYKGMALGTNASEGLWMASPKGTELKDAKHVYWFESGYDAMAYYQLHHRQNPELTKAVFLSTGGNPSVMQFRGVIKQATTACHHLCFDNDLAGKQYVMNFNTELQRVTESITKANEKAPLKDLGTYDIPEWALCAMENGDYERLSDEETTILNEFMEKHFPEGFVSTIDWDNPNEFNALPAFGTRNPNALPNRGESPYLAVKTYPVQFFHPSLREGEVLPEITVQIETPNRGAKDFNDELKMLNAELQARDDTSNNLDEEEDKSQTAGLDMDADGELEISECDMKKLKHSMSR